MTEVVKVGDVHINYEPNLINNPQVTDFISEWVKVSEYDMNPFMGMFKRVDIKGGKAAYPRDLGVDPAPRQVERTGDRTPVWETTRQVRIDLTTQTYDLDHRIKRDTERDGGINQASIIVDKMRASFHRKCVDLLTTALNAVPASDTTARDADGLLGTISAGIRWNPVTKVRELSTTPQGWNIQKLASVKTLLNMGNVMTKDSGFIILSRYDSSFGFAEDEQAINSDYNQMLLRAGMNTTEGGVFNFMGGKWVLLGSFPNDRDGTGMGLVPTAVTVSSNTYSVVKEFAFSPMSVIECGSPDVPSDFSIEIYEDKNNKDIRFRGELTKNFVVVNPKQVVAINNRAFNVTNS